MYIIPGKFASQQALLEINRAFGEGGAAQVQIRNEFIDENGHLKKWVGRRIRLEVIELLPLAVGRNSKDYGAAALEEGAPTDEGEVD